MKRIMPLVMDINLLLLICRFCHLHFRTCDLLRAFLLFSNLSLVHSTVAFLYKLRLRFSSWHGNRLKAISFTFVVAFYGFTDLLWLGLLLLLFLSMRRRVVLHEIFTIIGCSKTHLILLNKSLFFLQNLLFFKPFSYQVSSWNTGNGLHPVRLQPAIGLNELIPYLIDAQSIVVKGQHEISTDFEVVCLLIRASLISIVVPIEAVL